MSKSQDLKQLTKTWYKRLKDEGFEDIEDHNSSKGFLKDWSSKFYTSQFKETNGTKAEDKLVINSAKSEYYRLAEHFLNDHKFESQLQRAIWGLHSLGHSFREIAKILNPKVGVKLNKDNINTVIKQLSDLMLEQMLKSNDNEQE